MAHEVPFSFVAVVVLYRRAPEESATLRTLADCAGLGACREIVLVDHGPDSQAAAADAWAATLTGTPVSYRHDPGNPPLGQAYNRAIRASLGDAAYVLILDQDSELPPSFVSEAARVAQAESAPSLMAPNIRAGDRIASPCRLFLGWGRRWPAPRTGWQSLRDNTLINSAAWLHRRVFLDWGLWYDPALRLYGVDTDFFRRLSAVEPRFQVLPLTMAHDLSFDSADLTGKVSRLDAILAANRHIYARDPWPTRAAVRALSLLVRLTYALRYRSPRFL